QGRARTGRHIGPETESMLAEEFVELIQHDSRSDSNGAPCQIKLGYFPVVAGEVYYQAVSDCPAHQAGPRASRGDTDSGLGGGFDDAAGLARAAGERHADGLNLINRGIGCVQLPCE